MRWWLVSFMALAAVSTWLLSSDTLAARAASKQTQTWEYHCVLPPGAMPSKTESAEEGKDGHEAHAHSGRGHHPAEVVLNHLGSKGWELVAIDPNNGHYCFKRRP